MYILITLLDVPRIQLLQNIWEVVEMRIYLFQWLWLPTMNPIQVWHQFTHFGDDDFGEARTLNGLGVGVHATEEYPLGCATWTPQRKVSGRLPWRRGVDSAQEKRVPINLLGDMCIRAGSPRGTLQLIDQNRQIRVSSRLIWFAYCRIARIDWCGRAGVGRAWTGDRRGVHGQGGGGGGAERRWVRSERASGGRPRHPGGLPKTGRWSVGRPPVMVTQCPRPGRLSPALPLPSCRPRPSLICVLFSYSTHDDGLAPARKPCQRACTRLIQVDWRWCRLNLARFGRRRFVIDRLGTSSGGHLGPSRPHLTSCTTLIRYKLPLLFLVRRFLAVLFLH